MRTILLAISITALPTLYGVPAPVSLRIFPESVTVWGDQSSQHFLVLAQYQDGMERDVTSMARLSLSAPEKGSIDAAGKFIAKANGAVRVTAQFEGRRAEATIRIEGAGEQRPFSFGRDIGAILTKRGCNNSDCHGGVKGKGGLKFSIDAQFPRDDYKWLVEGGSFNVLTVETGPRAPRINVKEPEKSLLLQKPTAQLAHGGGERFKVGSPDYETILKWIHAGAPFGEDSAEGAASIERVEVFPKDLVLDATGHQQLLVTAFYSNGRRDDITGQVLYIPNDPSVIQVDENGVVRAKTTGETVVLIRAAGKAVSTSVGVIEKPLANYPKIEGRNFIDQFVLAKLRKFNMIPSDVASDSEFLRRVCLDLTGTLPPPARTREFLADKNPHKRDQLIDRLIGSPEFVDLWTFRFADLLRLTYNTLQDLRMTKAHEEWIFRSIASNKPYDQMARERIAGQGYGAAARSFYFVAELQRPEVVMPELVRVFWGRRIECAQCHNHPFERWSQNQFWGLAAFFAGLAELQESRVVIDVMGGGHVDQPKDMMLAHPRTKEKVVPAFLDGTKLPSRDWMDPRARLAEWMTSNPYFAEATVNRMWGYFFGTGIVEPVDDFRTTNPPSNPDLLRGLARDFRDHGYDLRRLMRTIVQSRTYQASATPNETNRNDRINASHAQPKALEAAVLLDAISSVTGAAEEFRYHRAAGGGEPPPGARAVQLLPEFTPSQFLDAFGRSMRTALPVGHPEANLPQALHMLAGLTYTSKISQKGGRLNQMLQRGASDAEILDEFYLAALTRLPEPEEKEELLRHLAQRPDSRAKELDRLVWAILSSREFAYNH
jgi:hypothetical protein